MKSLAEFVAKYPPAPPRREAANSDEMRLLDAADGVLDLDRAPATTNVLGTPNDKASCHLWVLWPTGMPYIHELAPKVRQPLASGVAKHTNLTGGADASCGGELWVDLSDPRKIYVNGASGRYGPRTPRQLEDAVAVFRSVGFEVTSFGWDDDVNLPARVFRS